MPIYLGLYYSLQEFRQHSFKKKQNYHKEYK